MPWWSSQPDSLLNALQVGLCSDVGLLRAENQDDAGHFYDDASGSALFIVADGMGGHSDGHVASRMAVEVVRDQFFHHPEIVDPAERLQQAFEAAHDQICTYAQSTQPNDQVGTTCTTLALVAKRLYLAHVGDSRAYRIHEGLLQQLTRDHTLAAQLLSEGLLTHREAAVHPRRGALLSAMGIPESMHVDTLEVDEPRRGDVYLLCTDGLAAIPPADLQRIASVHPPQTAADRLVTLANEYGGHDNATVLILRFP